LIAFVIMRDRVTYAQRCVEALTTAGLDVVIVDHGSTWPEAREWLAEVGMKPRQFWPRVWHDFNMHPRDLWRLGGPLDGYLGPRPADERFIVTDCDVVPDEDCPADWPALLGELLDRFPNLAKAGLGLRIDDLPDHFAHKQRVVEWETGVLGGEYAGGRARRGDIDTTLAMYRRFEPFTLGPALRTVAPYVARHLPWYEDTLYPTPEQAYYRLHAEHGHWRDPDGYVDTHNLEA
jgi:hypothetical protein